MTKEVSLSEVQDAIKDLKSDRYPGFDGLIPEFYKATSDLLRGDLVHVINDQLARSVLI